MRWWDGAEWTGHVHRPEPVAQPEPVELQPEPVEPEPQAAEPVARESKPPPVTTQPAPAATEPAPRAAAVPVHSQTPKPVYQPTPEMLLPPQRRKSRRSHSGLWITLAICALAAVVLFGSTYAIRSVAGNGSGDSGGDAGVTSPRAADATATASARTAQVAIEVYAVDHEGSFEGVGPADLTGIEAGLGGTDVAVSGTTTGYVLTVKSSTGNTFTVTNSAGALTYSCATPGTGECPASGVWG